MNSLRSFGKGKKWKRWSKKEMGIEARFGGSETCSGVREFEKRGCMLLLEMIVL